PSPSAWSVKERKMSCSLAITSLSVLGLWQLMLTPIRANGLSCIALTSDRSWGQKARHCSQNSLQKSSKTTLPLSSDSLKGLPSWSVPLISGAALPTDRERRSKSSLLAFLATVPSKAVFTSAYLSAASSNSFSLSLRFLSSGRPLSTCARIRQAMPRTSSRLLLVYVI